MDSSPSETHVPEVESPNGPEMDEFGLPYPPNQKNGEGESETTPTPYGISPSEQGTALIDDDRFITTMEAILNPDLSIVIKPNVLRTETYENVTPTKTPSSIPRGEGEYKNGKIFEPKFGEAKTPSSIPRGEGEYKNEENFEKFESEKTKSTPNASNGHERYASFPNATNGTRRPTPRSARTTGTSRKRNYEQISEPTKSKSNSEIVEVEPNSDDLTRTTVTYRGQTYSEIFGRPNKEQEEEWGTLEHPEPVKVPDTPCVPNHISTLPLQGDDTVTSHIRTPGSFGSKSDSEFIEEFDPYDLSSNNDVKETSEGEKGSTLELVKNVTINEESQLQDTLELLEDPSETSDDEAVFLQKDLEQSSESNSWSFFEPRQFTRHRHRGSMSTEPYGFQEEDSRTSLKIPGESEDEEVESASPSGNEVDISHNADTDENDHCRSDPTSLSSAQDHAGSDPDRSGTGITTTRSLPQGNAGSAADRTVIPSSDESPVKTNAPFKTPGEFPNESLPPKYLMETPAPVSDDASTDSI
ncbi:MAG: hypothetical protein GY818_04430, partial [Planctomycetaceae bacterium]|nr:hypothetical protein [Planctomycetaceae bacterium]